MTKLTVEGADIKTASTAFYKALNAMFTGDITPMIAIWSHADDVAYLGPQGDIVIGWENVLECWKEQASLKLGGKVEPKEMHFVLGKDIAIVQTYEVGTNFIYGKSQKVEIRASNIFRKEDGKWKMIMHQTDPLPFLENLENM